jgi:hypothetical protein
VSVDEPRHGFLSIGPAEDDSSTRGGSPAQARTRVDGRSGSRSRLASAPTDAHPIKRPGRVLSATPCQARVAITARTQGSASGTSRPRVICATVSPARMGWAFS